ncbi:MAG: M56 family metallopeptidase [Pirellulaceae bacterium]
MIEILTSWELNFADRMLLIFAVGSTLVMLLAISAARMLHHRSASTRFLVWQIGFVGLLAIPLTLFPLPGLNSFQALLKPTHNESVLNRQTAQPELADNNDSTAGIVQNSRSQLSPADQSLENEKVKPAVNAPSIPKLGGSSQATANFGLFCLTGWGVGMLLMLIRMASSHGQVRGLIRSSQPGELLGTPVLYCDGIETPVTAGMFSAKILVPPRIKDWNRIQIEQVLAHESAHIDRRDIFWQCIASIAKSIFWFQPLVWLAERRMIIDREIACDDRVLQGGVEQCSYAETLVNLSAQISRHSVPREFAIQVAQKPIEKRILSILAPNSDRVRPSQQMCAMIVVMFAFEWLFVAVLAGPPQPLKTGAANFVTNATMDGPQSQQLEFVGQITDDLGNRLPKASIGVILFENALGGGRLARQIREFDLLTDSTGQYVISLDKDEDAGSITVKVKASSDECWENFEYFSLSKFTESRKLPLIKLSKGRILQGKLIVPNNEANGKLIEGHVRFYAIPFKKNEGGTEYYETFNKKISVRENGEFECVVPNDCEISIMATAKNCAVSRLLVNVADPVSIQLKPGRSVHGTVVDERGNPMKKIVVTLFENEHFSNSLTSCSIESSVLTDDQGRFQFPTHAGKCTVCATIGGGSTFYDAIYPELQRQPLVLPVTVDLDSPESHTEIVLREMPAQSISGNVILENGQSAGNLPVEATIFVGSGDRRISRTITDEYGNYKLAVPRGVDWFSIKVTGRRDEQGIMLLGMPDGHRLATSSSTQSIYFERIHDDIVDVNWVLQRDKK